MVEMFKKVTQDPMFVLIPKVDEKQEKNIKNLAIITKTATDDHK